MSTVVNLADVRKQPIKPKSDTHEHGGQKYTCTFDPNAPKDKQWVWCIKYVRTYQYVGDAPTKEAASKQARLKIHALNKRVIKMEES